MIPVDTLGPLLDDDMPNAGTQRSLSRLLRLVPISQGQGGMGRPGAGARKLLKQRRLPGADMHCCCEGPPNKNLKISPLRGSGNAQNCIHTCPNREFDGSYSETS